MVLKVREILRIHNFDDLDDIVYYTSKFSRFLKSIIVIILSGLEGFVRDYGYGETRSLTN